MLFSSAWTVQSFCEVRELDMLCSFLSGIGKSGLMPVVGFLLVPQSPVTMQTPLLIELLLFATGKEMF